MIFTWLIVGFGMWQASAPLAQENRPPWCTGARHDEGGLSLHIRSVATFFEGEADWPANAYASFGEFYVLSRPVALGPGPPRNLLASSDYSGSGIRTDEWVMYSGNERPGYDFVAWYKYYPVTVTALEWNWDYDSARVDVVDRGAGRVTTRQQVPLRLRWSPDPPVTGRMHERLSVLRRAVARYDISHLVNWLGAPVLRAHLSVHDTKLWVVAMCRKRDKTFPVDLWYVLTGSDSAYGPRLVYARSGGPVEPRYDAATQTFSLWPSPPAGQSKAGEPDKYAQPEISAVVQL